MHYLSSQEMNLRSGSGQQLVTAVEETATTNTLWLLRGPNDPESRDDGTSACTKEGTGEKIRCGSVVRMTHLNTMKNLHSHPVQSALSNQREVTAFGQGDMKGDGGDDWRVLCSTDYWMRKENVQFEHVETGKFLGASSTVKFTHQNCGRNCPIMNHLEVFGRSTKDQYSRWMVDMGIHLSK